MKLGRMKDGRYFKNVGYLDSGMVHPGNRGRLARCSEGKRVTVRSWELYKPSAYSGAVPAVPLEVVLPPLHFWKNLCPPGPICSRKDG